MKKLITLALAIAFVTTIVGCRAEAEVGDAAANIPAAR
jgi:hypothetical protein